MKSLQALVHRERIAELLFCLLLIYVPFIVLKASFLSMGQEEELTMSDGIYYLLIDIVFGFIIFLNITLWHIPIHKAIVPAILFGVIQCFFLISGENGSFVFVFRLLSWILILTGGFFYLKKKPLSREFIIDLLSLGYLFLTICTCYWEITVRGLVFVTGMNEVYWVLPGVSFAFLTKKKHIKVALLIAVGVASILSLKSGAIAAYILSLVGSVFITIKLKEKGNSSKLSYLLIFFVIALGVMWPDVSMYLESELGVSWEAKTLSVMDTQGSGRGDIWKEVILLILNSDMWSFLWGHGHNMVIVATKDFSAHNDFLEVLYDYGVFMLIIYVIFIIRLIKAFLIFYRYKYSFTLAFGVCISAFLILSMVSHLIIYPGLLYSFSIIWSICLSSPNLKIDKC